MKKNISKYLDLAIFFENRGFRNEAESYYNLLKDHLITLDTQSLVRISQFYDSIKEYEVVFRASRLAIEKSGDIQILAPLFFSAWEHQSQDFQFIDWLLLQPGIEYVPDLILRIAKYLMEQGEVDKAYHLSLQAVEKIEHDFRRNSSGHLLYVDALLHLLAMEYFFKNYNQSRFHLRKIMYLSIERIGKEQEIAYWAILLDEIAGFVSRHDWEQISSKLSGEVLSIAQFYKELSNGLVNERTIKQWGNNPFRDGMLEMKRLSYLALAKKLRKEESWYEDIAERRDFASNDLLTCLLYAEYIKQTQPDALHAFWNSEFSKHADRPEAVKAYWNAQKQVKKTANLEECEVTFLGGGEKIGGTSILISVNGHHLLLDAGMHLHEENFYPDYSPMLEKGYTLDDVDALLISHAHLDHTGAVPHVHKLNPKLPIFATEATSSLMKILLADTVRVGRESSSVMYSEEDVQRALFQISPVNFYEPFMIPSKKDAWKITYYPSGHILGAGAIHIEIKGISILFTGDYSVDDQKTVKGLSLPFGLKVDILITESTYGFLPTNASIKHTKQERLMVKAIEQTMAKGGSMLIPAFAVGRAQEIVLILKEFYKTEAYLPFNLFLDGRVTEVCKVYERFAQQGRFIHPDYCHQKSLFTGEGVQAAQDIYSNRRGSFLTFQDFMDDYIKPGNNCIVASSGMLADHSASARYAEQLLEDSRNTISFTGYLDEASPGHHILHTEKTDEPLTVKINGVEKEVRANIESFRLSAHAGREQILQLILDLQPKKVFLMHGEHERRYAPAQTIVEGEKIYPTLINLLTYVKEDITVIPAYNGKTYHFSEI